MKFKIGKFHFNFSFWISKKEVQSKKGGRPKTVVKFKEVYKLHTSGKSVREIASILHISKSTVSNILRNPQKYR
jgi:DNA invertase Pin-like site-specific DNA recombinase